jgi:hypothetical protein
VESACAAPARFYLDVKIVTDKRIVRFYVVFGCRAVVSPAKVQPYGLHYWPVCSGGEFQKFIAYRRPHPAGLSFSVELRGMVVLVWYMSAEIFFLFFHLNLHVF